MTLIQDFLNNDKKEKWAAIASEEKRALAAAETEAERDKIREIAKDARRTLRRRAHGARG